MAGAGDAKDYTCTTCGKTFKGLGYTNGSQHTAACTAKKSESSAAESKRTTAKALEDEFKANKPKSVRKKETAEALKKQYKNVEP
ncbi:unnamed protein product [Urochloa humidicola]